MTQPEGFISSGGECLVCRLRKSIYGLKQSSCCWNTALYTHLKMLGFTQADSDPCIYWYSNGGLCWLVVYVADIVLMAEMTSRLSEVKAGLAEKFEIKDMGELHHFLGMNII